jgi:hypothetical protein
MCLVSLICQQPVLEASIDSNDRRFKFTADHAPHYDSPILWCTMWGAIAPNQLQSFVGSVLPSLHNLEWVELMFPTAALSFVTALIATEEPEYDQDIDPIALPSLRSLSLPYVECEDGNFFDELIDCLAMRDQCGYRLRRLSLMEGWGNSDRFSERCRELSPFVDEGVHASRCRPPVSSVADGWWWM